MSMSGRFSPNIFQQHHMDWKVMGSNPGTGKSLFHIKFSIKKLPSNSSQQCMKEPGVRPKNELKKMMNRLLRKVFLPISLEVCQDKVWAAAETKLVKLQILEQQRFVFILINIFSLIKNLWLQSPNCKKDLSEHSTTFVLSQKIDAVSVVPSTSAP